MAKKEKEVEKPVEAVETPEEVGEVTKEVETEKETVEAEEVTKQVVFNTNVKLGEQLYAVGEKATISQDDYESIVGAGVVEE